MLWGIGLISLMASAVVIAERFRIKAAGNIVENARAESLAEAGINRVRLQLVQAVLRGSTESPQIRGDGQPLICAMPGRALAALAIDDEGGKVDLNAAPLALLSRLLRGFGANAAEADALAQAIADFTHPAGNAVLDDVLLHDYERDGRPYGPKRTLFDTVFELDQVKGMRTDLLRRLIPYVTVHSHKPGVDPVKAAPVLLAALGGRSPFAVVANEDLTSRRREALAHDVPAFFWVQSSGRSFLVHAEVRTADGGRAVREAIIDLTLGDPPDVMREWRSGASRFQALLDSAAGRSDGVPPC
ncbi:hypothetical protein DB459_06080 [Bradyrhizobium sp. WD16]|nr:hypothetical protein DB459_06080 [Bradyrhizobium sp. WD16]